MGVSGFGRPASNMVDQLAAAAKIVVFKTRDFHRFKFREKPIQVSIIGDQDVVYHA